MKLISLQCPQCGAQLEVEATRNFVFCQYCGNKILIDDGVKRSQVTHIIRDEAQIQAAVNEYKELELEQQWRDNRSRAIKKWAKVCLSFLLFGAACLIVFGIGSALFGLTIEDDNWFLEIVAYLGILSVGISLIGYIYGGIGFFIALLAHNRKRNNN